MTLCRLLAATAAALVAVVLSSSPAAAQDARGWTQQLDVDLSARELGLPPGAAAPRLARAALERNGRRLGLQRPSGLRLASRFTRDWQVPGRKSFAGRPYPAHMRDYDTTPPLDARGNPIPHFNSTILSHAYYEFVKRLGHAQAGRVLHNVPATLSPFPTFKEIARGFVGRAGEIYPHDGPDAGSRSDAREAAEQAFSEVGIHVRDHRGEQPG